MSKTANELSDDLKKFIINEQSDAHNRTNLDKNRYNNLKIKCVMQNLSPNPQIQISVGISDAIFDIASGLKLKGSLGPDEKYAIKWLQKTTTKENLKDFCENAKKR